MVAGYDKRRHYETPKKIFLRGGVDPQLIQNFTKDPYARILEGQSPLPPSKMVNCNATAVAAALSNITDCKIGCGRKRMANNGSSKAINGNSGSNGHTGGGGGGGCASSNWAGDRSFLVNFLNLIHAFLVNRCRNDKSYTVSHTLVRQSVCLYAASSFILMLCCLVTSTEANDPQSTYME